MIKTDGDPGLIEKVEFTDLCGTVAKNFRCELYLFTLTYAKYYYNHSGTHPNSLHYCPLEDIYAVRGPFESVLIKALFFCCKPVDLSDVNCQSYNLSDLCPAVCPVAEALHENVLSVANSCLEALEEFSGTVFESRGQNQSGPSVPVSDKKYPNWFKNSMNSSILQGYHWV